MDTSGNGLNERPTTVRYWVVLATTLTAFMLYLDRVCLATITNSDSFQQAMPLSDNEKGWILAAFFLAYALAQVPSGWLADKFGARGMMAFYVAAWSIFTALTGLAGGFVVLLIARLGCGVAQAGAFPASSGLLARWVPFSGRAAASSVVALGGRIGGALAPKLTATLLVTFAAISATSQSAPAEWRMVLVLYGLLGLLAAWLFYAVFREKPNEHPAVNAAEAALIEQGRPASVVTATKMSARLPLRQLIASGSMWLMCITQIGTNIGWVFLVSWVNPYLTEAHQVSSELEGTYITVILAVGMIGMPLGGWLTDRLTRRFGLRWGRSVPIIASRFAAMTAYLVCIVAGESTVVCVIALAAVSFFTDMGVGPMWAYAQDVGGRYVGSILGWANMWGNLGAFAAISTAPSVLEWAGGDWNTVLLVCAGGFCLSGLAAFGIDATRPIASV